MMEVVSIILRYAEISLSFRKLTKSWPSLILHIRDSLPTKPLNEAFKSCSRRTPSCPPVVSVPQCACLCPSEVLAVQSAVEARRFLVEPLKWCARGALEVEPEVASGRSDTPMTGKWIISPLGVSVVSDHCRSSVVPLTPSHSPVAVTFGAVLCERLLTCLQAGSNQCNSLLKPGLSYFCVVARCFSLF